MRRRFPPWRPPRGPHYCRIRVQSCDSPQDDLSARMAELAEFLGGARLGERKDSRHGGGHLAGIDQRRDMRELRAVRPHLQAEDTPPKLLCLLLQRFAGRRDRDECSARLQERERTNARVPAHEIEYEIDAPPMRLGGVDAKIDDLIR